MSESKTEKSAKKTHVHELFSLDDTSAQRGLWLVKVPKYMSEKFAAAPNGDSIGKLKITQPPPPAEGEAPRKPEVVFTLNRRFGASKSDDSSASNDHGFFIKPPAAQDVYVLNETSTEDEVLGAKRRKCSIAGKIVQRAECRPIADEKYMRMKRRHIRAENKPNTQVVQLDRAHLAFKPTAAHIHSSDSRPGGRERDVSAKNLRLDRPALEDQLFNAFAKHQYYSFTDLIRVTKQPPTYLREVLQDLGVYNTSFPHKNMWELKPEFRHYSNAPLPNPDDGSSSH